MNSSQLFYINNSQLILFIVIKIDYISHFFFDSISKSKPVYFIFFIVYSKAIKYNKKKLSSLFSTKYTYNR